MADRPGFFKPTKISEDSYIERRIRSIRETMLERPSGVHVGITRKAIACHMASACERPIYMSNAMGWVSKTKHSSAVGCAAFFIDLPFHGEHEFRPWLPDCALTKLRLIGTKENPKARWSILDLLTIWGSM